VARYGGMKWSDAFYWRDLTVGKIGLVKVNELLYRPVHALSVSGV